MSTKVVEICFSALDGLIPEGDHLELFFYNPEGGRTSGLGHRTSEGSRHLNDSSYSSLRELLYYNTLQP